MSENLALWNKLGKTDPSHTKTFKRAGGFGGTAIKPIYTEQKMTEEFGPCGIGWGINEPTFQTVPGSEGTIAVYCTVSIWYKQADRCSEPVYGVGGDMVVVKQSDKLRTDDEAFKKAFTDAIGNAMKHIGMSADVHMGLFDDSKYVSEVKNEIASKADSRPVFARLSKANAALTTIEAFNKFWAQNSVVSAVATLPQDWSDMLAAEKADKAAELDERAALSSDPADPYGFDKLEQP